MEKIYPEADDKFVKTTVLYSNSATSEKNNYIYSDIECFDPIPITKLNELFLRGCVIYDIWFKQYSIPVSFKREIQRDQSDVVSVDQGYVVIFDVVSENKINLYSAEYKFPSDGE